MAPSTIRKAIGAVKDQTSISLAKVAGNVAPVLEVLIVKATTHDNEPAEEKHVREILNLTSYSRGYVNACVFAISKRLSKTHDWIVALKTLMLVHRLLSDGDPIFGQEIMYASRKGTRLLNMSGFRDEAHSNSWDHSGFVRSYAGFLDQKLEFMVYERKLNGGDDDKKRYDYEDEYGEFRSEPGYGMNRSRPYSDLNGARKDKNEVTPVTGMKPERILERFNQLLWLFDRLLGCRPTGSAKNSRMIIVALNLLVKESFRNYVDIREVLGILFDRFLEMEYVDCVKAFDTCVNVAKMIDELAGFYSWCKDTGVVSSSESPEVQKISDELLGTLEGFLRVKANRPKSPEKRREDTFSLDDVPNMNEIKALPPPEDYRPPPTPVLQPIAQIRHVTEELVNLKDDGVSADEQGNKLALALFSGPATANPNGAWETFPTDGETEVNSAWQNPAAESGIADWESTLVESASNLSRQKANLAGGFDSLLLSGMYDQGAVRQHVNNSQLSSGSASTVTLPLMGKGTTPVLALPAPDGTIQPVGQQDPFAASLSVPPPSFVQIADMERKQQLLTQEQQLWQQYASNGMQGQMGLAKIAGTAGYYGAGMQPMMPYGMPQVTGMGQPGVFYHTPY